jgi:hypothetical protein
MSDDTKEEWNVDRLGALVEAFNDWDDEYIKTDGNNMSVIHTHEDLRNAFIAGFQAGKRGGI